MEQIIGETVGEVCRVANMHDRKAEMFRQSDCFIALPGNPNFLQVSHTEITYGVVINCFIPNQLD